MGVSLLLAPPHVDPIQLMSGANVLRGILSLVLVVFLLLVGNNRRSMRKQWLSKQWLSKVTNVCLVLTALLMFAATALLFFGLLTGQGG